MSLHVIFIDNQGQQLSDITSNFTSVLIPQNAFVMRICDDTKSYSNSTLTKLFEIDNTFYSKVLEYTLKGDYQVIDVGVQDFGGFTAIFNQLSAQFVGNNPPANIYDFTGYGGSGSGGNIDFSTIVTALNSIATALSALTNLSNLSNLSQLANIITAIQNKDNQSSIVDELRFLFSQTAGHASSRRIGNYDNLSVFKGYFDSTSMNNIGLSRSLFASIFRTFVSQFSSASYSLTDGNINNNSNKLLVNIADSLQNIETKLENNLPFTTLAQVDVVTDYTQVVKGVGKNE